MTTNLRRLGFHEHLLKLTAHEQRHFVVEGGERLVQEQDFGLDHQRAEARAARVGEGAGLKTLSDAIASDPVNPFDPEPDGESDPADDPIEDEDPAATPTDEPTDTDTPEPTPTP